MVATAYVLVLFCGNILLSCAAAPQYTDGHQGANEDVVEPLAPTFSRPSNLQRRAAIFKPSGNMLRLKCPATGSPSPNITWFKNGATPDRQLETVRYGRWSMTLEDLLLSDSGNYTCLVCNNYGCINFTFKVIVLERLHHAPILIEIPRNTTVVSGESATLRCHVLSDLHVYIRWHNGRLDKPFTQDNMKSAIVCEGRFECMYMEELTIRNVTAEDAGWYTCICLNSLGMTSASTYISVVQILPDPDDETRKAVCLL